MPEEFIITNDVFMKVLHENFYLRSQVAELTERLTVLEADDEPIIPTTDDCGEQKWTYEQTVTGRRWRIYEDNSVEEYIGEVKTEQYAKDIVGNHNQLIVCEASDEEPYDIASERWNTHPKSGNGVYGIDCADLRLVDKLDATDEQMRLMAAAPELADRVRKLMRGIDHRKHPGESIYPDGYILMLELLDKLNIKRIGQDDDTGVK